MSQDFESMMNDLLNGMDDFNGKQEPTEEEISKMLDSILGSLLQPKQKKGSGEIIVKHKDKNYLVQMIASETSREADLQIVALDDRWSVTLPTTDPEVDATYNCGAGDTILFFVWNLKELEDLLDREYKSHTPDNYDYSKYKGYWWN